MSLESTMQFRKKRVMTLIATVALVLGACGGEDSTEELASAEETSVAAPQPEAPAPEAESDAGDPGGPSGSNGLSMECAVIVAEFTEAQAGFAEAAMGAMTGDGEQMDYEAAADGFDAMASNAPQEIRADFQVVADWYREYMEALAEIDVEPGEQPSPEQMATLQELASGANEAELQEASQNIEAYFDEHC